MVRPFLGAGLGASVYALSYRDADIVKSKNETNARFTLSPEAGIRVAFTEHFMYTLKGYVFLMDSPPAGFKNGTGTIPFPKSDKLTGYGAICFGFNYRCFGFNYRF